MNRLLHILLPVAAVLTLGGAVSCTDNETPGSAGGSGNTEGYFFKDAFSFNVTSNPVIEVPVVRLGQSGDLTVTIASSGASEFSVPSTVTIKDGDRMAIAPISYSPSDLQYNKVYTLVLKIMDYSSIYGYQNATVTIEYPTSYYKFATGTVKEEWWAEEEPGKDLYVRDFAADLMQCYIPDCWGHDSGPGYDVQNYVFYWNTKTNQCYVPFQYMGWRYMSDMGAKTCRFGGPGYEEGSTEWFDYIDNYYKSHPELTHPHFDPDKNVFYLADSNWYNENGENSSGDPPAKNDSFVID